MAEFFIGRQPILDRDMQLYAYELLFRSGQQGNQAGTPDDDFATSQVITTAFTDIGLDKLVRDKFAFVNVPYRFIVEPDLLPMDPDQVVLELLESVQIDDAVVAGIETLHKRGFTIALDDFIYSRDYDRVLPYVDLIKIDITQFPPEQWATEVARARHYGCRVLAEKVETQEEYARLRALKVDYYQGYFFARPSVVAGQRIASSKLSLLQLLAGINDPDIELEELQRLISKDVGISVKSLNYVNSAASGLNRKVESIHEAIIYLGRNTIRSWVTLIIMASVDDKPDELMIMALVRARFCEMLAARLGRERQDRYFTVGLFSVLDSLLDAPLEEIIEPMSLPGSMQKALLRHEGEKGAMLRLAMDMEFGFAGDEDFAGVGTDELADMHLEALSWADDSFAGMAMH
ncbi:HDOD domain-containing protein [Granulosicoccaceae sp. 1_MG-2023]|nr:HDOD domain-containing protein [Granulosicoccaceae sp. 1_MG-2023]